MEIERINEYQDECFPQAVKEEEKKVRRVDAVSYTHLKSASFIVQAIAFKQTGNYIRHQKELLQVVSADERVIVFNFLNLKKGGMVEFDLLSETLLIWSKKWIAEND